MNLLARVMKEKRKCAINFCWADLFFCSTYTRAKICQHPQEMKIFAPQISKYLYNHILYHTLYIMYVYIFQFAIWWIIFKCEWFCNSFCDCIYSCALITPFNVILIIDFYLSFVHHAILFNQKKEGGIIWNSAFAYSFWNVVNHFFVHWDYTNMHCTRTT